MNHQRHLLLFLSLAVASALTHAQEICDNGVDDDADGLVDLNDTVDCDGVIIDGLSYILPNRDFEQYDCIPATYSELHCADTWSQATGGTSDYFRQEGFFPTIVPEPLPSNGAGCVGGYVCPDYKEYVGGCLYAPLLEGTSYVLRLQVAAAKADNYSLQTSIPLDLPPTELTIWGSATCPSWPLDTYDCPESLGWEVLGVTEYMPTEEWQIVEVQLFPWVDINAIMIGGPCDPVGYPAVSNTYIAYFMYDDLSGTEVAPGMAGIDATGALCTSDLRIHVYPEEEGAPLQWYRNGVAIVGQTGTLLDVSALGIGAGLYACRMLGTNGPVIANYQVDDPQAVVPEIEPLGAGLFCSTPGFYQWFLGGYEIPGATGSFYEPTQPGTYTVQVTSGEGCTATSAPYFQGSTGIGAQQDAPPSVRHRAELNALVVLNAGTNASVEVLDMTGRLVHRAQGQGLAWQVDIGFLSPGVYTAVLDGRGFRFVH